MSRGKPISPDLLYPVDDLVEQQQQEQKPKPKVEPKPSFYYVIEYVKWVPTLVKVQRNF